MADRNPNRLSNWKVICEYCRTEFLHSEKIDLVNGHFQMVHKGQDIRFETKWIGVGPAPKSQPKLRQ